MDRKSYVSAKLDQRMRGKYDLYVYLKHTSVRKYAYVLGHNTRTR